jgi:hypothetical protein
MGCARSTTCRQTVLHGGQRLDRRLDRRGTPVTPGRGAADAEPLAHLAYAVRSQEFLDNIEPSERVYHLGDPATVIRHALARTHTRGGV